MIGHVFSLADGRLIGSITLDDGPNSLDARSDITMAEPPDHQPGDLVIWNGSAWTIQPTPSAALPSLEDIKSARWLEIKAARQAAIDGGMSFGGMRFDSYADARANVAGVFLRAMVAGESWATRFTLADNTPVTLTRQQVLALGPAVFAHVDAQHEIARGLRASIMSAETIEQVAAVVWPPLPSI